jgi:hypothetical protein
MAIRWREWRRHGEGLARAVDIPKRVIRTALCRGRRGQLAHGGAHVSASGRGRTDPGPRIRVYARAPVPSPSSPLSARG